MIVGVPRESFPDERRVALVPLVVPNLTKAGFEVVIEAGAGSSAGYPDGEYAAKGAKIVTSRADVFRAADIVVQVLCYGSNDKTGKADVPLYRQDPKSTRLNSSHGYNPYAVFCLEKKKKSNRSQ